MSHYYVEPLAVFFTVEQLSAASEQAQRDPANVTDHQLQMIACYDRDAAQTYARRREEARAKAQAHAMAWVQKAMERQRAPAAAVAKPAGGVTAHEKAFIGAVVGVLKELKTKRDAQVAELEAQNAELKNEIIRSKDRITALQTNPAKRGVGIHWGSEHEPGKHYEEGCLVQRKGGLWLSLRDTEQSPGMDPLSWRLVLREGKVTP